ncbi:MAG: hypothetical protein IKJ68_13340 [Clostridia bacterium]|nr:hypothetical protein [Clostridia bacterium]
MIQGKVFLMMGIAGIIIGFLFDIFRAFRISFRGVGKKFDFVSAQITDVIFAVIAFCIFIVGVYVFNGGELRSYCFLGTMTGIFIYIFLLERVIGRISRLIFKILYKISIEIPKKVFTKRK